MSDVKIVNQLAYSLLWFLEISITKVVKVNVAQSLFFCVVFCESLFVVLFFFSCGHCNFYLSSIYASDYPLDIFKLVLQTQSIAAL
jgi:hypothetical protein